jgi:hypothetical protein
MCCLQAVPTPHLAIDVLEGLCLQGGDGGPRVVAAGQVTQERLQLKLVAVGPVLSAPLQDGNLLEAPKEEGGGQPVDDGQQQGV